MMNRSITIGLVQMQCDADAKKNLATALRHLEHAAKNGAQIACLPELFLSPYFCQKKDDREALESAEPIPNAATKALSEAAAKLKIVLVGGSVYERAHDGKKYNTALVFGPDGNTIGTYRKTHIPEDALYHEQHYFAPGDTGIRVFDTPFGKICPLICFDQWFPEAARIAALKGAEIIFYPTAIGTIDESVEENITGDWEQMWRAVQVGHAAANTIYIAAVNRVGTEGAIHFWGGSFVADPSGKILAKADNREQVLLATCDLARVHDLQDAWGFIRNRRPDTYSDLTQ
ncbi:carbon-nitrogen hydrolase [Candidatus Peregrinibacteria bacterium]|nr:carbon-nitrogen hydrolase [Candidatus Peregrinibacteria bacterium]